MDHYENHCIQREYVIAREPGFVYDEKSNLSYYILEGGDVIPGGIESGNYDVNSLKVLWNGPGRKQSVKRTDNLKKMFFEYLKALKAYSQGNFGLPLVLINFTRLQMHRGELNDKSILTGCANIIGEKSSGKSTIAKIISKL